MPDGERVTTGSEPRRFRVHCSLRDGKLWAERLAGAHVEPGLSVEVVEPGHDEQNEARKNIERMRELADEVARLNAQIHGPWQPDPRTVAAVVEWLRGRSGAHGGGFTSADDVATAIAREFGASG